MASAVTPDAIINSQVLTMPSLGRNLDQIKCLLIKTPATAAQADTYSFDLANVGGTTLLGVYTVVHSTLNSIIIANAITTAVVGTVVTFTIPAAGGTKARATKIYFN